ncbi:MAG: arginine deiminase family protein [Acidobacteriota bacterium]|nr:arginine deiminase family protein [Acidobacteriota bacterium]
MNKNYGSQSMIAPLRKVLVKRPDKSFGNADPSKWHYTSRPNLTVARKEHDTFVSLLRQAGADVIYHDEPQPDRADAIYVFDPVIITDQGAVILRMGKDLRRGEEIPMARCLEALGIPVYYSLHGQALAEGGDLLWLDHDTLAVGLGFRTNAEGLRQLKEAFSRLDVNVMSVELPYFTGPDACLHLLSLISIVDHNMALIYRPLLSVPFWKYLKEHGFQLIEVPEEEFKTMGPNVLATAPGNCIMLEGNPITRKLLEKAGCRVSTYSGKELSLKAEGGPTCLTRPILRE